MEFASKEDFENFIYKSYADLGLFEKDYVYVYSDFRGFGIYSKFYKSKDSFCDAFMRPLVTNGVTVICATFTYTFEGIFEVYKTPTTLGLLNSWFMRQDNYKRSEHPIFSYAAIGKNASIVENIGKSAFGKDSIFDRLVSKKASFLHIGRQIKLGNTSLHYIEQICGATYRSSIAINTKVFKGDKFIAEDYTANLKKKQYLESNLKFNFEKAEKLMTEFGLINRIGDEESFKFFGAYDFNQTIEFLVNRFYIDPNIFLKINFIGYE